MLDNIFRGYEDCYESSLSVLVLAVLFLLSLNSKSLKPYRRLLWTTNSLAESHISISIRMVISFVNDMVSHKMIIKRKNRKNLLNVIERDHMHTGCNAVFTGQPKHSHDGQFSKLSTI